MSHLTSRDSARIEGFDFARALAILGMAIVHFTMAMEDDDLDPTWFDVAVELLDGRAAALFVLLAGIGVTLMTRRAVAAGDPVALRDARKVLVRRGLFLLVAGYVNLTIWPGDILRVYGVSLFVAAGLLTATNRLLLAVALEFVVGFIVLFSLIDYSDHWDWETLTYDLLWTPAGIVHNLFYDGFRSVFPWTGLFLVGMRLGRLDWNNADLRRRALLLACATLVITASLSYVLVGHYVAHPHGMDEDEIIALLGTDSMPPMPLFLLSASSSAVATIAVSLWMAERFADRWWFESLVATGQMAFTWYVLHIVLGLGAVVELGWEGNQPTSRAFAAAFVFFALAMLVSTLLRRSGRRGPLEWAMRRVTG